MMSNSKKLAGLAVSALLLAVYWVLSYQRTLFSSPLYLMFPIVDLFSLLPLAAGAVLSFRGEVGARVSGGVAWIVLALALLPVIFPYRTTYLAGIAGFGWLSSHTPSEMRGICALICGAGLANGVRCIVNFVRAKAGRTESGDLIE